MNSLKSPTILYQYDIIILEKKIRGDYMQDKELKELQEQIEQIIGIEIENNKEKTIEDEVTEILNLGDEE